MVKVEQDISSLSSDSDNEPPSTPLAASTQIATRGRLYGDLDEQSSENDDSEVIQNKSKANNGAKTSDNAMQKYLTKFPNVRLSKPRYNVDLDLTDPDNELYLVTCPASIDAMECLLNATLDIPTPGKVRRIDSSSPGLQLEAFTSGNHIKNPVTILVGKQLKSFVPTGTIQIRECLEKHHVPKLMKQKNVINEVPFPEIIRERHPLLGLHYKSVQKLPKRVQKSLSMARQRADMWYLQDIKTNATEVEIDSPENKKRKRTNTADNTDISGSTSLEVIKQEKLSPSKRKVKKEKPIESTAVEDDLSWLQNI
ncbi:uncharacterized protein LOC129721145 isoform X2 [Wyeomyia smithii]|uniref:uncharacterized protein LOC129721145 isoform X2 n=1 Tax=Wyeomyia smithii TaxID=174621 RepID=UPI0024680629|nr:uncharacterized protein LOC129721145 isoform X2 [Wyeomyia smithii]